MKHLAAVPTLVLPLVVAMPPEPIQPETTKMTEVARPFSRVTLGDIELEFNIQGSGEPIVLVQPGIFFDWYETMVREPALASRYRLVSYHRAGSAGSSHPSGPLTIADHAAHLRGLLRHLGIARAHFVGHSSGGPIVLQLALDAPDVVQSLALLESARPAGGTGPEEAEFAKASAVAFRHYSQGDKAGALDAWLRAGGGADYRTVLTPALSPGAFERYVADADAFFGQEVPAVRDWAFTRDHAKRIAQPVLLVLGASTPDVYRVRHKVLLEWLSHAEPFLLPDATHLLQMNNPRGMAKALSAFFARHPLRTR